MAETHHFQASRLFSVKNHVCLVTGGATGIGLMATQALAANGAKVYITGRRKEALDTAAHAHSPDLQNEMNESGGQIIALGPCDVRSKDDLQNIVRELGEREKRLHLLVCNAGIAGPKAEPRAEDAADLKRTLWENESVEEWQQTLQTDVTSVYFTAVAFLPLLQAAMTTTTTTTTTTTNSGRSEDNEAPHQEDFAASVITISSISGLMRHAQGHFSYNAAKGATVHLTKLMSAEFLKARIRVNSIAPGYFPSEMTAKESDVRNKSSFPQEKIESYGHVPLMRAGRDEEIGMAVLFLAKNCYVNGQILAVDGGVLNVVAG